MFVFSWLPSVVRCFMITHQHERGNTANAFKCEFPFQANPARSSGPSMIRPLRQSLVLRNTSAAQDVQGFIRVLHLNQPLVWEYTNVTVTDATPQLGRVSFQQDNKAAFLSFIDHHPRTRITINEELRIGVSIPLLPGAMSQYKECHEWNDLIPNHDLFFTGYCACTFFI